uniref:Uncharacterized protein n=2 Tax=Cucumis melo TaxID=3656 RepID=A0A9I9DL05_CUCME
MMNKRARDLVPLHGLPRSTSKWWLMAVLVFLLKNSYNNTNSKLPLPKSLPTFLKEKGEKTKRTNTSPPNKHNMQLSASLIIPPPLLRPSTAFFPKLRSTPALSSPWLGHRAAEAVVEPRCVSQGGWGTSVAEVDIEEWLKLGRLEEKCGSGGKGIVELLECLEKEAIMGEDEGREPTDYNRRAKIFSTSSEVFQALKQHPDVVAPPPPPPPHHS